MHVSPRRGLRTLHVCRLQRTFRLGRDRAVLRIGRCSDDGFRDRSARGRDRPHAKGGELQCDRIYFEYRLPGSLSSIYLRVLSPLALTALRDWTPMELAWR